MGDLTSRGLAAKLPGVLLGLLLALGLVYGLAFSRPEVPNSQGVPHPDHASAGREPMRQGGPGAPRHGPLLGLGWALGTLIIALFVGLMAFGLLSAGKPVRGAWWLGLAGLVYAGLFGLLVVLYQRGLDRPDAPLVGGLPAPTAVLLYGLWPWPAVFTLLYAVRFDDWVLTVEDRERFRQLVAARRRRQPNDTAEA